MYINRGDFNLSSVFSLDHYEQESMQFTAPFIVLLTIALLSLDSADGRHSHYVRNLLNHRRRQQIEFPQACAAGLVTGSWVGCAVDLGKIIWSLHTWGDDQEIKICGMDCVGNLKGRVSKLEWVWDAQFQCPTRAPGITGDGTGFASRQGAMEKAVEDFIVQAIQAGKIKAEEFKC